MQLSKITQEYVVRRSQKNGARGCEHRRERSLNEMTRTVIDDSGSLAITAWACAVCGDLVEEIHILLRDGAARPLPIRYAVAAETGPRRVAALFIPR